MHKCTEFPTHCQPNCAAKTEGKTVRVLGPLKKRENTPASNDDSIHKHALCFMLYRIFLIVKIHLKYEARLIIKVP